MQNTSSLCPISLRTRDVVELHPHGGLAVPFLELADAPPAGRASQSDLGRDLRDRHLGVALEQRENLAIVGI